MTVNGVSSQLQVLQEAFTRKRKPEEGDSPQAARTKRLDEKYYGTLSVEKLSALAVQFFAGKRYEEAIHAFTAVLERDGCNAPARKNRFLAYLALGQFTNALSDVEELIKVNPQDVEALSSRALVHLNLKNYTEAIEDFNKALDIQPKNASTLAKRGRAYHCLGKLHEAISDFTSAIQLRPDDLTTRTLRANANRHLGLIQEAISDFEYLMQRNQGGAQLLWSLARLYFKAGKYGNAIPLLNQFLIDAPDHIEALYWRAKAKYNLNDFEGALQDYNVLIRKKENDAALLFGRGLLLLQANKNREAYDDFLKVSVLKSDHTESQMFRAMSQYALGQKVEALKSFEEAIAKSKEEDLPNLHYHRGVVKLYFGYDYFGALQDFSAVPSSSSFARGAEVYREKAAKRVMEETYAIATSGVWHEIIDAHCLTEHLFNPLGE